MTGASDLPFVPTEPALYEASIIIPLFNRVDLTVACLRALAANTGDVDHEIVLVDNASSDETPELLAGLGGDVKVVRNEENLGFATACNQGARTASSERLVFLNNDTEPWPGWLPPLLGALQDDDVVAAGSLLLFPDGTVQHAGVVMVENDGEPPLLAMHHPYQVDPSHPLAQRARDVAVVTGASFAVDRQAFFSVGGFDEGSWNGFEDVDLCLQLADAGGRIRSEPASVVTHHESASGPERFRRTDQNTARLIERWHGRVTPDLLIDADDRTHVHPDGFLAAHHTPSAV